MALNVPLMAAFPTLLRCALQQDIQYAQHDLQGSGHVRDIFYRMGFNDQEIVALLGAHTLGRCYTDRSGYEGPWSL